MRPTASGICRAASHIRAGGVVAFPTETVYGLGADATNPRACAKIFEIKKRPSFDPLIVHIARASSLRDVIDGQVDKRVRKLIDRFWPGPLTIVFPKSAVIADIVTAGLSTVAVRMPANSAALRLISESSTFIAAPSANIFGRLSPTTASHVMKQLRGRVRYVIDGGRTRVGIESTIVAFHDDRLYVLRHGGIPIEAIRKVVGKVYNYDRNDPKTSVVRHPGQLKSHYSPSTPLVLVANAPAHFRQGKRVGLLSFRGLYSEHTARNYARIEVLSRSGDMAEAASNLFSCLHRLDSAKLDFIVAEQIPRAGLGAAIMERLEKACHA